MNRHAIVVLEFEKILSAIANRAATPMGREHVLGLTPLTDPSVIRRELATVSETRRLLGSRSGFSFPPLRDARLALRSLEPEGSVLNAEELSELLALLASSRTVASEIAVASEADVLGVKGGEPAAEFTHLGRFVRRLPAEARLEERLSGLVDEDGALRDDASSVLRGIRKRLRSARVSVVRRLEKYVESLPATYRVEGASVSVRDGYYVVPVRREGKSHVGGVVRGESATGATLFVEPPLALQLASAIHELEREEGREIQRILREATDWLRPLQASLSDGFSALVELDSLYARARASVAWDAIAPDIYDPGDPSSDLCIKEGRHPLLLDSGGEAVPFSLDLTAEERVVVVSGPNTGGKTVLLKALGLIPLLAQSGIHPPVGEGTRLPVLRDVFADIGDEQSIAESLSTFSARIRNVKEILGGARVGTFVLLDELGSGTDPAEGGALARAVLEALVESGARAFVTSHLGSLKRLDEEGTGIVNASLLFDGERMAPTFELRKGQPGRSFGLAIARRLGFPSQLLDRAEGYVGSQELKLEALLETLERKERDLAQALGDAQVAGADARRLAEDAEARNADIERRERSLEAKAREQARDLLLEARQEVEAVIQELQATDRERASEAATRARRRVEEAAGMHRERALGPRTPRPFRGRPKVAVGDRARIRESGSVGVVREIRDDRIAVEIGGVRVQIPWDEVESVPGGGDSAPATGQVRSSAGWDDVGLVARQEVDLRGLRVDEATLQLERALDAAVVGNLSEIKIVHGFGTGAVRARTCEVLGADRRVESFRVGVHGEGGAGVTIAMLR